MAVEAARIALENAGSAHPESLWLSTATPAYCEKTNALVVHAALRLDQAVRAADACGAGRSAMAVLYEALDGSRTTQLVVSDLRVGPAGSADEAQGGDGAASVVVGNGDDNTLQAVYLGGSSVNREFLDRWRGPQSRLTKTWEERHSETRYLELFPDAWARALKAASLESEDVNCLLIAGPSRRINRSVGRFIGRPIATLADELDAGIGWTGAAHPILLLCAYLDEADPHDVAALVSVNEGIDVTLFRSTGGGEPSPAHVTVREQQRAGLQVPYGKYLAWRSLVEADQPRRPQPARVSSPAAARAASWKYAFVGSRDTASGEVRLPPAIPGADPNAFLEPAPFANTFGTVVTYTIDRLAYSPSPPIVFAVVDFDGGGRLPVELTDVDPEAVDVGMRVEMTFRRLGATDDVVNYFWKARPLLRSEEA